MCPVCLLFHPLQASSAGLEAARCEGSANTASLTLAVGRAVARGEAVEVFLELTNPEVGGHQETMRFLFLALML